jgi:hypothetical protein
MMLVSLLLAGCAATLPAHTPLPQGLALAVIGRSDPEAPFAWHPDADTIAFVRGELRMMNLATGDMVQLDATPSAIAWTPDGALLAAVSAQGKDSLVRVFDRQGAVVDEVVVPGHVSQLAWRFDRELLAPSQVLERFKFGVSLRTQLYRWRLGTAPTATILSDVTIMPSRAKAADNSYFDTFSFALSPLRDEIAYTRLVDPPNFPSYQKIIVRNLESGAEQEASGVKLGSAGAVFSSDAEQILYGDGAGMVRRLSPWAGGEQDLLTTPGHTIALSPADRYLFADGRLFLEMQQLVAFPTDCAGEFSQTGTRLLLRCGDSLSLLSGLADSATPQVSPTQRERLLSLRKWRSEKLISNKEYQTAKQRILAP